MDPRGWDWKENEEEIRTFIRDLGPEWERQFDIFVEVERSSETSFDLFFKLFASSLSTCAIANS
jgi:hypothetical protein